MGRKTVTIPDDVYRRPAAEKRAYESFGDTVGRLLAGRPLSSFWGAWSEATAESARVAIDAGRQRREDELERSSR